MSFVYRKSIGPQEEEKRQALTTAKTGHGQFQGFRHGGFEVQIVAVDLKINAAPKTRHAGGGRDLSRHREAGVYQLHTW